MNKLRTIRLVTKICWMMSGTILVCYGFLLALTGFLGSEQLPSICWAQVGFGVGLFLTGVFFIWHAKRSG